MCYSILISGSEKEFYLRAHNEECAKEWVKALKTAIEQAKALKFIEGPGDVMKPRNCGLDKQSHFWKVTFIMTKTTINFSMMLFQRDSSHSWLTQVTFSSLDADSLEAESHAHSQTRTLVSHLIHYLQMSDHVALVLKFESDVDEVYFLESTSNKGVSISRWSSVRKYLGDFYQQVVLRHLDVARNDEMTARLEIFL